VDDYAKLQQLFEMTKKKHINMLRLWLSLPCLVNLYNKTGNNNIEGASKYQIIISL
jgi:hypothetical protein